MTDKKKNVVLNFKMDGQVQYAETLKQINMVMNTAAKEYKNHISAMGKDATATDKLRAEKKKLEIQMEGAQKRTKMLSDEFEAMSKDTKTTAEELNKMYGKLLDAQNAEVALEKSLTRVNEGLSDQAQEAREAKDTLKDLKGESKLLESEQKNLTSSFKLQRSELGANASEAEKLELAQRQLKSQMDLTERTVDNLERQLDSTKKVYGENSVEVMKMETKINEAKTTIVEFKKSLDGIEASGNNAGDGMEELGKKMDLNNLMQATELLQGVAEKLLEVGKAAMDSALEFGDSQTNLQANLGLTSKEAEKLNEVVDEVFKNGVVGSIEEATEAVSLAKSAFKDLNDTELEKITNKITTIAKRTGTDVQENVRGAEQLMIAFGLSGDEALDLIASGYQNGLNRSDDFMDTVKEYSPQFAQAGFSADEMMNIINNGLESGAFNADKAADAVKEFGVKLSDGTVEKSIGKYSDGTQKLFEQYKNGKATASDVFSSISNDIASTDDKQKQYEMGTAAFGTMYEDLGVKAVESFAQTGGAIDDVNGKADEMAQKSPGEQWESSLRELQSALLPIGQNLIDALTPIIEGLATMGEWFGKLPGPVQTFITVFGGILVVVALLTPIIIGLAVAVGALNVALLPIILVVVAVAAAIAGIILIIQNWGAITDWIGEKFTQFITWISEGVSNLSKNFKQGFEDMKQGAINKVTELKDGAVNKFNELKTNAGNAISGFKDSVINKVTEIKTGFINKVNELKEGAVNKFNSLKSAAGDAMNQAKEKILSPIESAKEKIRGIVDSIKNFFSGMKLKIPKIEMPKLPKFSITGKFGLNPISVPKLDIKWNAKGGIFTEPTIFGSSRGKLQGAGEAGTEAALPLNDETLGAIGKGIASTMGGLNDDRPIIIQIDGKTIVEVIRDRMDEGLANRSRNLNYGIGRIG